MKLKLKIRTLLNIYWYIKIKLNYILGAVRAACADYNTNCAYWASVGECNNNPAYMLNYCQQSCNVCNTGTGGGKY